METVTGSPNNNVSKRATKGSRGKTARQAEDGRWSGCLLLLLILPRQERRGEVQQPPPSQPPQTRADEGKGRCSHMSGTLTGAKAASLRSAATSSAEKREGCCFSMESQVQWLQITRRGVMVGFRRINCPFLPPYKHQGANCPSLPLQIHPDQLQLQTIF